MKNMRKSRITTALIFGALSTLLAVSIVSAGTDKDSARSRADEVREHWTAERLQAAVPRDYVRDDRGRINPLPGKGNGKGKPGGSDDGSGDTDSTEVTGASWTTAGPVKSTTGKIYFEIGNSGYVCSGTVVIDSADGDGRSTVLTAGHCLYDEGTNGSFAQNLVFIPDFDSDPSSAYYDCSTVQELGISCWVADHLVTSKQWADGGTDKWSEDYGFAIFLDSTNGGSLEQSVGGAAYSILTDALASPQSIHAFGYPAAKKYNGSDLVYCAGDDGQLNDGNPETTAIKCKMTGGASGGAWLLDFDRDAQTATGIRSLTSYSYSSTNGYLFGPIFDGYTQEVFNVALSASGDAIVDSAGNVSP